MSAKTDEDIRAEARDWIARLNSGETTAADRAGFDAWKNADPAHVEAFESVGALWRDVAGMDHLKALIPPDVDNVPAASLLQRVRAAAARPAGNDHLPGKVAPRARPHRAARRPRH